jgi:hypothetical protein
MNSAYSRASDGHAIDRSTAGVASLELLAESTIMSFSLHGVVNAAHRSKYTGQHGPITSIISALCGTSYHNCSSLSHKYLRPHPYCSHRQQMAVSLKLAPPYAQTRCKSMGTPLQSNADRQQHGRKLFDEHCFYCDNELWSAPLTVWSAAADRQRLYK